MHRMVEEIVTGVFCDGVQKGGDYDVHGERKVAGSINLPNSSIVIN